MSESTELTERMRQTSSGNRCESCLFVGKVETARSDGTALSEADRCPGCGRVICDRHTLHADRDRRHGIDAHSRRES